MRLLSAAGMVLIGVSGCSGGSALTDAGHRADGGMTDGGSARVSGIGNAVVAQGRRVVVAGSALLNSKDADFLLVGYHADGGVDSTFGANGKVTTSFDSYTDPLTADAGFPVEQKTDTAYAVVLQGDKLLVGGAAASIGDLYGAFGLARYTADGVLDTTFGVGGRVQLRLGSGGPLHALGLRSDGKIYAGGFVTGGSPATGANFGIARFTADGNLDAAFGGAQGVMGDFGKNEDVRGLAFQNLKVLAGGGDDFLVARYHDDGTLDTTFGVGGVAKSEGGIANNFRAMPNGTLLLSGSRRTRSDGPWIIKLVRYTADGQLDSSFGSAGVLETPLDQHQFSTLGLEVMPDGRILTVMVGGYGTTAGVYGTLARYSASGVVDTALGNSGVLALNVQLPLLLGPYPPSANHTALVGDRLFFTQTDIYAKPDGKVIFLSFAVP